MFKIGQHVKCILKNSLVLEGFIEEWSNNQVILKSIDDNNLIVLHAPNEILITKIILSSITSEKITPIQPKPIQKQIKEKLQQIQNNSEDMELNNLSIDELKNLVKAQEKAIINERKKEHFGSPGNAKMTRYMSPYNTVQILKK